MNSRRIQLSKGLGGKRWSCIYSHLNEVQNECGVKKDKIGVLPYYVYISVLWTTLNINNRSYTFHLSFPPTGRLLLLQILKNRKFMKAKMLIVYLNIWLFTLLETQEMNKFCVHSIITYVHYFQGHVEFHKFASISHLSQYGRQAWNGRIRASDFQLSECGFDSRCEHMEESCEESCSQCSTKTRGFSLGTPVSNSHRT